MSTEQSNVEVLADAAERWAGFLQRSLTNNGFGSGRRAEVAREQVRAIEAACSSARAASQRDREVDEIMELLGIGSRS